VADKQSAADSSRQQLDAASDVPLLPISTVVPGSERSMQSSDRPIAVGNVSGAPVCTAMFG